MKKFELKYDKHRLSKFCQDRGIRRLSLFGSALREDYRPGQSDIDILAEFEPGALRGIGLEFFFLRRGFEQNLGRQSGLLLQVEQAHQTAGGKTERPYL